MGNPEREVKELEKAVLAASNLDNKSMKWIDDLRFAGDCG
jgi:hypothetical protein